MFPLEIFPERSLAASVITTVWVGIFVIAFFNLRFGWPLAGLVVPGYLVPLMIAKPACAIIICLQGFITYFVVRYACEGFLSSGLWSSFFGRDRFFAMIIVSLGVRLVLDGWILPTVGEFINRNLELDFDYRNNFASFGLIIVALVANQFWKTGFVRGLVPFWVTMGLTYVIVRCVLMEYTNFSIGNLEYMYENISASLVASPKAYIILLTCAFAASRMNLLYGWDFNGILIPSLLALEWYQPLTIVSTFVEAFVILGAAAVVLKLPVLQQTTVEGSRKLLLFFNISFMYKMVLGHCQPFFETPLQLTEFYGYGYLVPTLIAVKMHDKHIPLILTRATLQTSLVGAVIASVIGFCLTFVPAVGTGKLVEGAVTVEMESGRRANRLAEVLREDKVSLYRKKGERGFALPLPQEADCFVRCLRNIERYAKTGAKETLQVAQVDLARIGYGAEVVDERYLYVRETGDIRGWGIFVFDLSRKNGMVVEIPAPVDEWAVLEAGAFLFEMFGGRVMAVAGCSRRQSREGAADVLRNGRTLYSLFHRIVGRRDVLQIRGYTEETIGRLGREEGVESVVKAESRSSLWVKRKIPEGLELVVLKDLIGSYQVEWGETPYGNLQRDETRGAFGELVLSRESRKKLLAASVITERRERGGAGVERTEGRLQEWLLDVGGGICGRGGNEYVPAKLEEMLLFDEEILVPLLKTVREIRESGRLSDDAVDDLELVAANASIFDYKVLLYADSASKKEFLLLVEREDGKSRRCWGTYVFRLGDCTPYCVQVPRPGFERSSLEYGVSLFGRLDARCLTIAGSHPLANEDGSSDLVDLKNKVNLLNLVSQVILRESRFEELMIIQTRAFGFRSRGQLPAEDVLIGLQDGCSSVRCLSDMALSLYEMLQADNLSLRIVSGDPQTSGYEAFATAQAQYALIAESKEVAVLWLSPFFRSSYRQESNDSYQALKFEAVGVNTREVDLFEYLKSLQLEGRRQRCPDSVGRAIDRFVDSGDVVLLMDLSVNGVFENIERVVDVNSRRSFLLGYLDRTSYPVVFNLAVYRKGGVELVPARKLTREAVNGFIRSLSTRLEITADR